MVKKEIVKFLYFLFYIYIFLFEMRGIGKIVGKRMEGEKIIEKIVGKENGENEWERGKIVGKILFKKKKIIKKRKQCEKNNKKKRQCEKNKRLKRYKKEKKCKKLKKNLEQLRSGDLSLISNLLCAYEFSHFGFGS
ncbi:hypothetical protein RFI_36357 [Reticulomyxa filosa]|uniref:Uncharacterized protein n=1 Tax=Reticulomyxa filosa TaxID=46433 RepID=X6LGG8_RETFI|nr:hypothetical protein RFI_36357 [Reticulomyxa filosa]|eukprot:ETO01083.1 hypothetical protein RFI_36357 [Reticulomyxa filosa]